QMCCCSQTFSGRSSATPRSRVMGLWAWLLTKPGTSAPSGRLTVSAAANRARACARGSTATIAPSRTATAWSSRITPCGSTGITKPASMRMSQDSGVWSVIRLALACHPRAGRNPWTSAPFLRQSHWIPACAGMAIWQSRGRERPRAKSSLHPRDVFARARVDLDHLVLAHEQRHADHGAGFQLRRLAAAARGVAAHAGVGLGDLQLDEVRRGDLDRGAVPQRHHALFLALEPLLGAAHAGLVGLDLLE